MLPEQCTIQVNTNLGVETFFVRDILFYQCHENGSQLVLTENRTRYCPESCSYFDDQLHEFNFVKINDYCTVNLFHLKSIRKKSYQVVLTDQIELEMATNYRSIIRSFLTRFPLVTIMKPFPSSALNGKLAS